jgi:hypothetical protein
MHIFEAITRAKRKGKRFQTRIIRNLITNLRNRINTPDFVSLLPQILEPVDWLDEWFMKPFNGQSQRIKHTIRLVDSFKPTIAIETGTYYGTSTAFLSRLVSGVTYSIEANPKYFEYSKKRLANEKGTVHLVFGDSSSELPRILEDISSSSNRILAYLDAHWYENVPTQQEIESLMNWGGGWIAIIDDFEIPSDPGYKYDKYEDVTVGLNLIPKGKNLEVWVSGLDSEYETGAIRGTGYVFTKQTRLGLSELALEDLIQIQ